MGGETVAARAVGFVQSRPLWIRLRRCGPCVRGRERETTGQQHAGGNDACPLENLHANTSAFIVFNTTVSCTVGMKHNSRRSPRRPGTSRFLPCGNRRRNSGRPDLPGHTRPAHQRNSGLFLLSFYRTDVVRHLLRHTGRPTYGRGGDDIYARDVADGGG